MFSAISNFARKEFSSFFASPAAYIFIGVFMAVSLFVFFWVETFFSRNIADVRPLFEWMPLLLVFLVSALTMKSWSEERRMGTLEFLMTAPTATWQIVAGKFIGAMGLVSLALLCTLPLPITVSFLGDLDWGPVVGAYIASLFLSGAYVAIGLFMSSRTDNQVVSLITTALVCGFFYVLGSPALTSLFGNYTGEFLRLIGSGSRFDSITRGVLDIRDIYYYVSIMGLFLLLNLFVLEKLRWDQGAKKRHHLIWKGGTALLVANLFVGNIWLHQVTSLRVDMTEGNIYSLSDASKTVLDQARQPLLIRGYFTAQTHPLLSPLVPRLRDLLREYEIAASDNVRVEFIDPLEDPKLEAEASNKFDIKPVTFQSSNKYEASVVNSYFNIVIQYGDQHETLGFRDLIDVKARSETDLTVDLRNPEFDITQAIKKVIQQYEGGGDVLAKLDRPVTLQAYISDNSKLPTSLAEFVSVVEEVSAEFKTASEGLFLFNRQDPDANEGKLAKRLREELGLRPLQAGLFDDNSFWFTLVLRGTDDMLYRVPLPQSLDKEGLESAIKTGLQRYASGYLKTVALHAPKVNPQMARYGMGGQTFYSLRAGLDENVKVIDANLSSGKVPDDADFLLIASPKDLTDKELFAIDQFLMKGGSVAIAASPYEVNTKGALSVDEVNTGLEDWLEHHGLSLDKGMIVDSRSSPFPVPVERSLGGIPVQQINLVAYPPFVDVRAEGLNKDSLITSGLSQVTLSWASPVSVDTDKNSERSFKTLLRSSDQAWLMEDPKVQPDYNLHDDFGFEQIGEASVHDLGILVEGEFTSFFAGKEHPLVFSEKEQEKPAADDDSKSTDETNFVDSTIIERSTDAARIFLIGSDSFLSDEVLELMGNSLRSGYFKPIELVENVVDYSLGDRTLMEIRSRGQFSRTLAPIAPENQLVWEYGNYLLAVIALTILYGIRRVVKGRQIARYRQFLEA
ncbi:Gldg family protein [Sneathiella glossodoripedis]|uniref:Gldg family protein n=1 Tax=Sneathiella glossodoripedis TaxID=418853 RepID=UPI00046F7FAC|nr:Gldg family protein [Sneathiella glossodoripedis]